MEEHEPSLMRQLLSTNRACFGPGNALRVMELWKTRYVLYSGELVRASKSRHLTTKSQHVSISSKLPQTVTYCIVRAF